MKHDAKVYLHDIQEAGKYILEFTDDATVWSAIESNLSTLLEEINTLLNSF